VRPILARVRKSLFDILRFRLKDALFLDLYAGTGTVGLEALSNGARRAVFVDASRNSLRLVEENAALLGFRERVALHTGDATKTLAWLRPDIFDVVFMGPPYVDEQRRMLALTVPTLERLRESGIIGPHTIVVGQHHKKESLASLSSAWEITRQNHYGETWLSFFKLKPEVPA
jgi:16S rRNA (guanine(966)-N(2))-methyltransferase RsmD